MYGANPLTVKGLEMLLSEYRKVIERYRKKRSKEIEKLKVLEGLTESDIHEMYGYGDITEAEMRRRLKLLEAKNPADDGYEMTAVSELIRMLSPIISHLCDEIGEEKKYLDGGNRQG